MFRTLTAKRWLFLTLAFIVFILDQATKYPFRNTWQLYQSKPVLPVLAFTYVKNTGSLFGLFQGNAFILGLISLSVSLGICWYVWKQPREAGLLPYITLGFLLGGALGNMLDRLAFGFVVDFFDIQWQGRNIWPVFNVADIAVDIAIGLFILMSFLEPTSHSDVTTDSKGELAGSESAETDSAETTSESGRQASPAEQPEAAVLPDNNAFFSDQELVTRYFPEGTSAPDSSTRSDSSESAPESTPVVSNE